MNIGYLDSMNIFTNESNFDHSKSQSSFPFDVLALTNFWNFSTHTMGVRIKKRIFEPIASEDI